MQGFYHISFYSKYWLLNNTQMPLQVRLSQPTFSFPSLELPYQSLDFDFDTAKNFGGAANSIGVNGQRPKKVAENEDDSEEQIDTRQRQGSIETL